MIDSNYPHKIESKTNDQNDPQQNIKDYYEPK